MRSDELLMAFHVRSVAIELRSVARSNYFAGLYPVFDEHERRLRLQAWDNEHPIQEFLSQAVDELENIAEYVTQRENVSKENLS